MSARSCFVCFEKIEHFGYRDGYDYFKCNDCGTIQLNPLPSEAQLSLLYKKEYSKSGHHDSYPDESRRLKQRLWNDIKRALTRYLPKGRVLDYGGGWGGLCELINSKDLRCEVVDQSEEMVAHCRKIGIPVTLGNLDSFPDHDFDAIVLCTVFEHLINHDEWLRKAYKKLKEKGLLISLQPTAHFAFFAGTLLKKSGKLPDLNGAFSPPWHTGLISCKGMSKLLERNRFETVEIAMASSTRRKGVLGLFLRVIEAVNRIAWPIFKDRWPLVICHTFVFRKA